MGETYILQFQSGERDKDEPKTVPVLSIGFVGLTFELTGSLAESRTSID